MSQLKSMSVRAMNVRIWKIRNKGKLQSLIEVRQIPVFHCMLNGLTEWLSDKKESSCYEATLVPQGGMRFMPISEVELRVSITA